MTSDVKPDGSPFEILPKLTPYKTILHTGVSIFLCQSEPPAEHRTSQEQPSQSDANAQSNDIGIYSIPTPELPIDFLQCSYKIVSSGKVGCMATTSHSEAQSDERCSEKPGTEDEPPTSYKCTIELPVSLQTRLIFPATAAHLSKYNSSTIWKRETYQDYLTNAEFLATSWLDKLVAHANSPSDTPTEDIIVDTPDFLIIKDYKWDGKSIDNLYYLAIFKDGKYRSIREIDSVEMLETLKETALNLCEEKGVPRESVCIFFHYRPSYFRLHAHIVAVHKHRSLLGLATRNVLLESVIRNLKVDSAYYKNDCYILGME